MYFYNKEGKRLNYTVGDPIGGEMYGNIYKLSEDVCLKVYKKGQTGNEEILKFINELGLKNFYRIYELLYNRKGNFKAHTMKFYESSDIDILTMPMYYTLNNLYNIYESVIKLTQNNIFITDMHTGNIVIGDKDITIIDVDIYEFAKYFSSVKLNEKNTSALRRLFEEIYLEALKAYHPEYQNFNNIEIIRSTFELYNQSALDRTFKRLVKYKYPIDCLKK